MYRKLSKIYAIHESLTEHFKGINIFIRINKVDDRGKVLLAALLLTGAFNMPAEAAVQSEPLVVTKTGQTVTDDFDVKNCTNPAVLEIGSTAAADTDDVTAVDFKISTALLRWVETKIMLQKLTVSGCRISIPAKSTYPMGSRLR